MVNLRVLLSAALCFVVAGSAVATPRRSVDRIAQVIEDNYFDAARAGEIAKELRDAAKNGEFDALQDAHELARALTRRLVRQDRHFHVGWSPSPAASGGATAPSSGARDEGDMERRQAYGFRRVEMLPGAVGYMDLRSFAHFEFDENEAPARQAADAALRLIADADAVIIDLRDNGGGSPAMVGYLVSAFTAADADIYNVFHSREGAQSERPKTPYAQPNLRAPLFVLISGRTGSAAEAFAYTLQAGKRAVVVGQASAGAANPGDSFAAGEGFTVFVSTGSPRNAVTGANWEGAGVQPNVSVPADQAAERAHILALEAVAASMPNRPPSLDARWTLEALRAVHGPVKSAPAGDYVGQYENASVALDGGELILQRDRRPAWTLTPLKADVFYPRGEPTRRVQFARDAKGKVTHVELLYAEGFGAKLARTAGARQRLKSAER